MLELRIQVCWEPKGNLASNARLHHLLFGRRVKVRGHDFFYDGLLAGFKNGRRIKLVDYERFGPLNLSVPGELEPQIIHIFETVRIDHRVIRYNAKKNLFSKTYDELEISEDAQTPTFTRFPLRIGQANVTDFF